MHILLCTIVCNTCRGIAETGVTDRMSCQVGARIVLRFSRGAWLLFDTEPSPLQ